MEVAVADAEFVRVPDLQAWQWNVGEVAGPDDDLLDFIGLDLQLSESLESVLDRGRAEE